MQGYNRSTLLKRNIADARYHRSPFFSRNIYFYISLTNLGSRSTLRILHGSVVKCVTPNPGVLGSSCAGSSRFYEGVSLSKTLQNPSLVLVKPRKDMNVSCCCDMIEYCCKELKTPFNQPNSFPTITVFKGFHYEGC